MEIKPTDSEIRKYKMTWAEVFRRLKRLKARLYNYTGGNKIKAYGIPRGGQIVAGLLGPEHVVETVEDANVIVDDIIDSGSTAERWSKKHRLMVDTLVDKVHVVEDSKLPWVVFPWERMDEDMGPKESVRRIIEFIGEDPNRDGLRETPDRVLKSLYEMTAGYWQEPMDILSKTFDIRTDEMVVLDGIRFASLCEHHILPFTGTATVGYIPNKKVIGISKLARLVEIYARRLQVQERMTHEIAYALMDGPVKPIGVGVIVEAAHQCMGCRGVKQPDARMVTSCLLGAILDDPKARAEFLHFAPRR